MATWVCVSKIIWTVVCVLPRKARTRLVDWVTPSDVSYEKAKKLARIIDLDVDIGADAVDYKYVSRRLVSSYYVFLINQNSAIANQESLSGLEVEMRKLEAIVKEIVDEMGYLKAREERFADTNRTCISLDKCILSQRPMQSPPMNESRSSLG